MRGLEGKRILVTGGASGIGAAVANRFLQEGSKVVVLDRDPKGREQVKLDLPDLSGVVAADVTKFDEVSKAFAQTVATMGCVDVLINNAGISIRHNFLDITRDEWDKIIAVNLTGVFQCGPVGGTPHDGERKWRHPSDSFHQWPRGP